MNWKSYNLLKRKHFYSYFNDSTGFFEAAFMDWQLTVKSTMSKAVISAPKNIHT